MRTGFLCLLLSLPLTLATSAQTPNLGGGPRPPVCPEMISPGNPPIPGCPVTTVEAPGIVYTGPSTPVSGARVYLFAAGTTGYGTASTSAMSDVAGTLLDTGSGPTAGDRYVTTDGDGNFTLYFTCSTGDQLYAYAVGGTSTFGSNSAELVTLGSCLAAENDAANITIIMNEVTTVAAAYAMSGFATNATGVSSSGSPLAEIGIANAFLNASNLADISSGAPLSATVSGLGGVPDDLISSLADILAACNEDSSVCSTLTSTALSNGATGTSPADAATAAIYIAHNPAANISTLFGLVASTFSTSPPFSGLAMQPNDFTIGIHYTPFTAGCGGSCPVDTVQGIAIDGAGDVWMTDYFNGYSLTNNLVAEISSAGNLISPSSGGGYSGAGLYAPKGIAIDPSGTAWVTNQQYSFFGTTSSYDEIVEVIPPAGSTPYSATATSTSGGIDYPAGLAFDPSGYFWVANAGTDVLSKFNSLGTAATSGYTSSTLSGASGIASDNSGNMWVTATNSLVKVTTSGLTPSFTSITIPGTGHADAVDSSGKVWVANSSGNTVSVVSGTTLISGTGYTGGGLNNPIGVAIDGAGNAWFGNEGSSSVTEFTNGGTAITGTNGFQLSAPISQTGQVAIDGSGDVWVGGYFGATELIGAAAPVVTPLSYGVATGTLGTRP